jgi:hypothetical protein
MMSSMCYVSEALMDSRFTLFAEEWASSSSPSCWSCLY